MDLVAPQAIQRVLVLLAFSHGCPRRAPRSKETATRRLHTPQQRLRAACGVPMPVLLNSPKFWCLGVPGAPVLLLGACVCASKPRPGCTHWLAGLSAAVALVDGAHGAAGVLGHPHCSLQHVGGLTKLRVGLSWQGRPAVRAPAARTPGGGAHPHAGGSGGSGQRAVLTICKPDGLPAVRI